jgi:hypothetical protein
MNFDAYGKMILVRHMTYIYCIKCQLEVKHMTQ